MTTMIQDAANKMIDAHDLLSEIRKLKDTTAMTVEGFENLCQAALFYAKTMPITEAARLAVEEC